MRKRKQKEEDKKQKQSRMDGNNYSLKAISCFLKNWWSFILVEKVKMKCTFGFILLFAVAFASEYM